MFSSEQYASAVHPRSDWRTKGWESSLAGWLLFPTPSKQGERRTISREKCYGALISLPLLLPALLLLPLLDNKFTAKRGEPLNSLPHNKRSYSGISTRQEKKGCETCPFFGPISNQGLKHWGVCVCVWFLLQHTFHPPFHKATPFTCSPLRYWRIIAKCARGRLQLLHPQLGKQS